MKFDTDTVTFETAGDERLRIASDGKVKIGHVDNVNPTEPLHVVATAVNQDIARFTGANKDRGLVISTAVSGSTNDSVIKYDAVSTNSVGQHAFLTDGDEKFRIHSNGDVQVKTDGGRLYGSGTFTVFSGSTSGRLDLYLSLIHI